MAKQATILTIETIDWGGIPTMVDAIYHLMEDAGYETTVYRTRTAEGELSRWERLKNTLLTWKVEQVEERGGLRTALLPTPPFPLWMHYLVPQYLLGPILGEKQGIIVVSGGAHVALPLALRGLPYVIWVATPYEDELQSKVQSGDEWAKEVLNDPGWRLLQRQERAAVRGATRVLALSFYTARRLKEIVPRATEHIDTMLFPIDTDMFKPDTEAQGRLPYGRYLLFTARINDPRKNIAMLLRAFALARDKHSDLKLILAGEFPDDNIKGLTTELGLNDAVEFLGTVEPRSQQLIELYQGATLFVLPSTQEGLGISVLEAIACGTPVVATPCGGPEGVVVEGQTGRMISSLHDHEEFGAAIIDLLDDAEGLATLREKCVEFAQKTFSRKVMAAKLYSAFEEVRNKRVQPGKIRSLLAAVWSVFIVVMFIQHQAVLHSEAILTRIIEPILERLP